MALTTTITTNEIMNRVAAEVGLQPVVDPFSSLDPAFIQMKFLLNTAGEELLFAHAWEFQVASHQILTSAPPEPEPFSAGQYPLPDDFAYMINQTGWERNNRIPLGGPLSAQDWTYLKGRDLAQNTLYASFRIAEGVLNIYPDPPPAGLDINFEYISTLWVDVAGDPITRGDKVTTGADKPRFDKTLITRAVKVKYL